MVTALGAAVLALPGGRWRTGPLALTWATLLPGLALAQGGTLATGAEEAGGGDGGGLLDRLDGYLHTAGRLIEVAGIVVIVAGVVLATALYLGRVLRQGGAAGAFEAYRANLGRGILLGLELLVAADIIGTVAVDPTPYNLGVLAAIVLIRTFLSFSLEVEIEGRWPWRREAGERGGQGR